MLQRWSRICWKWSMFWKACNKHNTWERQMCMGYNQQKLVTNSVRTRSWSGVPKTTVAKILMQDLGMKWCAMAKFIPQLLLLEQKKHHASVANDLIQTINDEPDFLKVITGRWIVGLWLWSGNEGPVIPMEIAWFSTPEESAAKSQQDQDHVNSVFLIGKVLSIMSTPLQA